MDYKKLFDSLRASLGPLKADFVQGVEFLVPEFQKAKLPLTHASYILATVYHETAYTMQPIEEIGGTHARYAPYYGRGYVQLTWDYNYRDAGKKLGIDLLNNPKLALNPKVASQVLIRGMVEGWFTQKKLSDFHDYVGMRKVVNGTDKNTLIAKYAYQFEAALKAGEYAVPLVQPIPSKEETNMSTDFSNVIGGIIRAWAPGLVTLLVSKHILPPGDYSDLIAVAVSLVTSVWSIKTNMPKAA